MVLDLSNAQVSAERLGASKDRDHGVGVGVGWGWGVEGLERGGGEVACE